MYNDIRNDLYKLRVLESSDQQINEGVISALAGKIGSKIFPGLSAAQYGMESYQLFKAGNIVEAIIAAAKAVGYAFPATAGALGTYELLKMLWDNSDEIIKLVSEYTSNADSDEQSPESQPADDATELAPNGDPDIAAVQLELQKKGANVKVDGIPSEELYQLAVQYKLIEEQYITGYAMSDAEEIRKYVNLVEGPTPGVVSQAAPYVKSAFNTAGKVVSNLGKGAAAATGSLKSGLGKLKTSPTAKNVGMVAGATAVGAGAGIAAKELSKSAPNQSGNAAQAAAPTPTPSAKPVGGGGGAGGGLSKDEEMELHALSSDLEYMARENPDSADEINKILGPYIQKYGK